MPRPRRGILTPARPAVVGAIVAACGVLLVRSFWLGPSGAMVLEDGGSEPMAVYSEQATARLWGLQNERSVEEVPVVAACVRIRNEARYLREWLEFHLLVGVTFFYVFDDDSSDETREVLAPYVASGVAFVWPMHKTKCPAVRGRDEVCADRSHDAEHGERGFRDECLRTNPASAEWILMTDVDEFLFPSAGGSVAEHLAANCDRRLAYVLVRWHVFGASGHSTRPNALSIEAYRERGREDDRGCYPHLTCDDTYAPPICAKVLARPRCVRTQGTHFVVDVDGGAEDCVDIYVGDRKTSAVDASSPFAMAQHEQCAQLLHLNHYAVRSREDFVEKFARSRISSATRDVDQHLADVDKVTGVVTRRVDPRVIDQFLAADAGDLARAARHKKARDAATREELLLIEFVRRDHSEVLDESILRFAAPLRRALGLDPSPAPMMFWACAAGNATGGGVEATASGAWRDTEGAAAAFKAASPRRKRLALFVHIPKTAGTTLNLVLRDATARERRTPCVLSFADLDRPTRRAAAARRCDLISAETDISVLPSLRQPRVALFAFLREPLSRVSSQYEHHRSSGRLKGHASHGDVVRVVSPQLCPQLERDASCASLRHPRKCKAGGWCSVFQNHQTHVLAGAQHSSPEVAAALRRTSVNLLCAARRVLRALPAVGLTERLPLSLCLLFDALGYGASFDDCCRPTDAARARPCTLFDLRATKHSAADRARRKTPRTNNATVSYLAKYLDDDLLTAAIYEGNALDCALYADAVRLASNSRLDPPALRSTSSRSGETRPPASLAFLCRAMLSTAGACQADAPRRLPQPIAPSTHERLRQGRRPSPGFLPRRAARDQPTARLLRRRADARRTLGGILRTIFTLCVLRETKSGVLLHAHALSSQHGRGRGPRGTNPPIIPTDSVARRLIRTAPTSTW